MTHVFMTTDPTVLLVVGLAGFCLLTVMRRGQRPKRKPRPEIEVLRSLDQRHWVTGPV